MEVNNENLKNAGSTVIRWVLTALLGMALFIFNEMRDAVTEIQKVVTDMSGVVIRLDEKVDRNKEDIRNIEADVKRLDATKQDK